MELQQHTDNGFECGLTNQNPELELFHLLISLYYISIYPCIHGRCEYDHKYIVNNFIIKYSVNNKKADQIAHN